MRDLHCSEDGRLRAKTAALMDDPPEGFVQAVPRIRPPGRPQSRNLAECMPLLVHGPACRVR